MKNESATGVALDAATLFVIDTLRRIQRVLFSQRHTRSYKGWIIMIHAPLGGNIVGGDGADRLEWNSFSRSVDLVNPVSLVVHRANYAGLPNLSGVPKKIVGARTCEITCLQSKNCFVSSLLYIPVCTATYTISGVFDGPDLYHRTPTR